MNFIDLVGVAGGLVLLLAFWRTSIGQWTGKSLWYELDNLIAAVLLTFYTVNKGAYVNVALNLIWGVVALRGVTSWAERRHHRQARTVKQKTRR